MYLSYLPLKGVMYRYFISDNTVFRVGIYKDMGLSEIVDGKSNMS